MGGAGKFARNSPTHRLYWSRVTLGTEFTSLAFGQKHNQRMASNKDKVLCINIPNSVHKQISCNFHFFFRNIPLKVTHWWRSGKS